jgi:SnoaL-like domain
MTANLPKPVEAFIAATHARDSAALMATFSVDAVLSDMGKTHRGEEIRAWNDSLFIGANVTSRVLGVTERQGATVVTVLVDGDYAQFGVTEPFELDWYFTLTGGKISALTMIEEKKAAPKKGKRK